MEEKKETFVMEATENGYRLIIETNGNLSMAQILMFTKLARIELNALQEAQEVKTGTI